VILDIKQGSSNLKQSGANNQMSAQIIDKKVVSFFLSARESYRPILFSQNEVFCGPDCKTTKVNGLYKSLKTHVGVFNIKEIIDILPENQKPELVVVKSDSTGKCYPANLDVLQCPKILILGNTQHLKNPIQSLIRYVSKERYEFILSDHKRHHLHYFKEVGLKNVSWLPGFNIWPHEQQFCENKLYEVSFVGQTGRWHPYRVYILNYLARHGVPLNILQAPHEKAAEIYAKSLINLNVSLNGDLNLRIFEVLSSGGFLITDKLAPESGLELLFKDGEHLICFENETDLFDKINYFLGHPEEAAEIARNGYEAYKKDHTPEKKIRELMDYILKGVENPLCEIEKDKRSVYVRSDSAQEFMNRVALYEFFQELHLNIHFPSVLMWPKVDARLVCDLADLPRLNMVTIDNGDGVWKKSFELFQKAGVAERIVPKGWKKIEKRDIPWDAIAITASELLAYGSEELIDTCGPKWLIISDGIEGIESKTRERLKETLAASGYEKTPDNANCYFLKERSLRGETLLSQGMTEKALRCFKQALAEDPFDERALRNCGIISYEQDDPEAAEKHLLKAVSLDRHDLEALICLARVYAGMERYDEAYVLFNEAVSIDNRNPELWFHIGRCCEELEKRLEAVDAYTCCNKAGAREEWQIEERISALTQNRNKVMFRKGPERILSPKRILVINNLYPPQEFGGYGRLLCDFANILESRGHTTYILTSDTPDFGHIEKDLPNIDRSLVLYGGWPGGVGKEIDDKHQIFNIVKMNMERMVSIIRGFRPELCLLGDITFLSHIIFRPMLKMGIPVIHHLGNKNQGYTIPDTPQSDLYLPATASRWLKKEVLHQGYPLKRISVVYPGAFVSEFNMHILPATNKLRIAYAGILRPYKGPHILIEALKRLHDQGIDFNCSLAGTSPDEKFLDRLKKFGFSSGMEDRVKFAGFLPREKLKAFFAKHNVLVFPSIVEEAFGISQVEAMAAGLTVVSSGTGGAGEIIEHGKSGIIFESEKSKSLARELMALVENPEKWEEISREGRKRAMEKFDIERSVDILEQEFLKLLSTACSSNAKGEQ
jgi:glycosyltransferase involved in cell wall biosynthesis